MSNYHRLFLKGGTYFFTVVTYKRQPILCEKHALERLKSAFHYVKKKHFFQIHGLVILPDHLHCIWQLPKDDDNYSLRWNMLKRYFSIGLDSCSNQRREKNIWQRRFWEHLIRDEANLHNCLDYIHYNPVKHGYVTKPYDWDFSTFRDQVWRGFYDSHWGSDGEPDGIKELLFE